MYFKVVFRQDNIADAVCLQPQQQIAQVCLMPQHFEFTRLIDDIFRGESIRSATGERISEIVYYALSEMITSE